MLAGVEAAPHSSFTLRSSRIEKRTEKEATALNSGCVSWAMISSSTRCFLAGMGSSPASQWASVPLLMPMRSAISVRGILRCLMAVASSFGVIITGEF